MHSLQIEGSDLEQRVVRFQGIEGISRLFRFEVTFVAHESGVALADLVGKKVTLGFRVGDDERFLNGIVARAEQGEQGKKTTAYRLEIVPKAHHLTLRRDNRIFQELDAPEIIQKVLSGAGLAAGDDFSLSLQGSYAKREYCVQYRETDWDFVSRLCEEEGIWYAFEHSDGGHKLVFGDTQSAFAAIPGDAVPFRPAAGALVSGEHVSTVRVAEQLTSGTVTLRDYDFKKPKLLVEGAGASDKYAELEVYDQPAEVGDPSEAKAMAGVRLEEIAIERRTMDGASNVARFVAGATFTFAEHPTEELNAGYLLVEVEHVGHEPGVEGADTGTPYENRFRAVPSDRRFRPARVTPRPVVHGSHTAIVVGPPGEEVHVDEHARIKVQFHWDRLGKNDDKSSVWMRVAQPWAGPAYGAMFIPRIGHEVVVSFLEGDPDRPIVTGSVYHGLNVPPYGLPAEKTKSTIKSSTSPGGGGSNELRFEDKKGQEEIYLHAQKDWTIAVENDKNQNVGHDETLEVKNDRSVTVGNNESTDVGASRTVTVAVNETDEIGASYSAKIGANAEVEVGANVAVSFGGKFTQSIAKAMTVDVGDALEHTVAKGAKESVGEDKSVKVGGAMTTEIGKAWSTKVAKDMTAEVEGSIALTAGKSYVLECGDGKVTVQKNGDITIEGKKIVVKGSGPIEVSGSKLKVKSDGTVSVEGSGTVEIKGSAVNVN